MKKPMLVLTISFVFITTTVFFLYPYLKSPSPVDLEGVYIRYAEHEYGREWDTLVINNQSSSRRYEMTRRWRYERLLDGNVLSPEYKRVQSAIRFLAEEGLFVEEESGIRYSYNINKNELLAGTTIYKKIK